MTVEIIPWSISTKVWDQAGISLMAPWICRLTLYGLQGLVHNIHVATMTPTKFQFNPTYGSRGDAIWISRNLNMGAILDIWKEPFSQIWISMLPACLSQKFPFFLKCLKNCHVYIHHKPHLSLKWHGNILHLLIKTGAAKSFPNVC